MFSLTFDDISVDEFFTDKDNPNAILFCYEPDKEAKTNTYFHGLSECQSFDGFFFEFLVPRQNVCLYLLNYRLILLRNPLDYFSDTRSSLLILQKVVCAHDCLLCDIAKADCIAEQQKKGVAV